MGKAVMVQGTGSDVGKSLIVAGLCRAFVRRGLRAMPFKPQNMSNNAAVTADGGEIGRAQALQALACKQAPSVHMNPVLLKPESETGAQVVVHGKVAFRAQARAYADRKAELLQAVADSFTQLKDTADLVIVEGAGSPAETNLRANDIANMGFARALDVPVILMGDINRGGVIAQLAGHAAVMEAGDRAQIAAFAVNRFRGDVSLFDEGVRDIERFTNWPSVGVIPWFSEASKLPAEDALGIASGGTGSLKIAVPMLARIANFDDLDPLKLEPGVQVVMVPAGQPLPGDAALVILPGSKSTTGDLAFLREQGWDIDLAAHLRRGGHVLGICGGYQMLGQWIDDPDGVDGVAGQVEGLGHLDARTTMQPVKRLGQVHGTLAGGNVPVTGYEIHMGHTDGPDCDRPVLMLDGRPDGATSRDGRVSGTYLHGLFTDDAFRAAYLARLGHQASDLVYAQVIEDVLDRLADHLERCMDLDAIAAIAR
ncbi:adenosylcobyric acid synthase (glutamine-hydrolysing) [Monaibacterium marinum]|uniref:Cobyric acid synthase n=1 Tax=Pontivivens marinum TaxID=1690039 RepID=A0A2C9CUX6_9RHOB|nr:cobyric acid synthase [Monaibacterium marinum]SOH95048.1 adenosylcobyric acid synthase (glutamine-hydrolysing) [Monaibacterium marinum]